MTSIIIHHSGKVIKNVDDGLLFYFPKTVNFSKPSSFQDVFDCGLAMIQANSTLNSNLHENGLPSIIYRISANYGLVRLLHQQIQMVLIYLDQLLTYALK